MHEFLQCLVLNKEKNISRGVLWHEEKQLEVNERLLQDFIINVNDAAPCFSEKSADLLTQ